MSQANSEGEIAVQLTATPSEGTQSTQELPPPHIATPEGVGSLPPGVIIHSGPPSRSESQSTDDILVPRLSRRGQIPIMSVDTPRPRRAGAFYTRQEAQGYAEIANGFANQCV